MKSCITHDYQYLDLKIQIKLEDLQGIFLNMENKWSFTVTNFCDEQMCFWYTSHNIKSMVASSIKGQEAHIHVR
jgi:hypothetical protein